MKLFEVGKKSLLIYTPSSFILLPKVSIIPATGFSVSLWSFPSDTLIPLTLTILPSIHPFIRTSRRVTNESGKGWWWGEKPEAGGEPLTTEKTRDNDCVTPQSSCLSGWLPFSLCSFTVRWSRIYPLETLKILLSFGKKVYRGRVGNKQNRFVKRLTFPLNSSFIIWVKREICLNFVELWRYSKITQNLELMFPRIFDIYLNSCKRSDIYDEERASNSF